MEDEVTNLSFNRFFTTLEQKFPKLYRKASDNCYLICVPTNEALGDEKITQALIENHILAPSPLFANVYTTISKTNGQVSVKDSTLVAGQGFKYPGTVRILGEELFYNAKYEAFRALVIDGMFDQPPNARSRTMSPAHGDIFKPRPTIEEQIEFLESSCAPDALQKINDLLRVFVDGYMNVKGFFGDLVKKVGKLHGLTMDLIMRGCSDAMAHQSDPRLSVILAHLAEGYLYRRIYKKVWEGVKLDYGAQDAQFERKCKSLQGLSGKDLGVSAEFDCDVSIAAQELRRLSEYQTPVEKFKCLKTVFGDINTAVEMHVKRNHKGSGPVSVAIASDDLIPLLSLVVIKAAMPDMQSQLVFLEQLVLAEHSAELSYHAVTLRTAVEYLTQYGGAPAASTGSTAPSAASTPAHVAAPAPSTPHSQQEDRDTYTPRRGQQQSFSDMVSYSSPSQPTAATAATPTPAPAAAASASASASASAFSSPAPALGTRSTPGSALSVTGSMGKLSLAPPKPQQRPSTEQMGGLLARFSQGF